ncbi:MAG: OmpA family protein [Hydrogenophaga sp.]|uniref:OmpA family protein n=1 Tax=Hydrogenophaga sp. TaxID=1904254 RepID=UPI0025C588BF|nr:OmpA family protein [Hydrogenophaga sp.]MBT9553433.1 OmpA family protein [Hydrogenophaga sp.]
MKNHPPFRLLALAGLGALLAAPAFAQDTSHFYGGVGAGIARSANETARTTGVLLPGVDTVSSSSDRNDNAFKVFGGYQINRNIALEAGMYSLGKSRFTTQTSPAGSLSSATKVRGLNFDVVGTLPFTQRFAGLARVGAHHAWSKEDYSGTGANAGIAASTKHNNTNYKVGVGLQYELSPAMWIRGEVERYRVKDSTGRRNNIDMTSVSLVFPFGRAAPRVVAAAPAPVYVAPAPAPVVIAPAPAPAPVVMAPAPQRVSFSADTLFGFDKDTVRPEGMTALDTFSKELQGATYQSITVEGHTDRLGSTDYNQALSNDRASSVKDYLVTRGKLDPSKISAVGKGEGSPVTQAADCPDKQSRTSLITCLQPDRRVEVEVSGTR